MKANGFYVAVMVMVGLALAGCGKDPKEVGQVAPAASAPEPKRLCDKETLEHCTDEQKALIRMSGSGLKK